MGTDKALLQLNSEPLIERAARRLGCWFESVVVVAATTQTLPTMAARVVRDSSAYPGPVAALALGLEQLPAQCTWAFATACDMPFIHRPLIRFLLEHRSVRQVQTVVTQDGTMDQPLLALYQRSLAPKLKEHAKSGAGLRAFCRGLNACYVERRSLLEDPEIQRVDPELRCLQNLNAPVDYQRACEHLDSRGRV